LQHAAAEIAAMGFTPAVSGVAHNMVGVAPALIIALGQASLAAAALVATEFVLMAHVARSMVGVEPALLIAAVRSLPPLLSQHPLARVVVPVGVDFAAMEFVLMAPVARHMVGVVQALLIAAGPSPVLVRLVVQSEGMVLARSQRPTFKLPLTHTTDSRVETDAQHKP